MSTLEAAEALCADLLALYNGTRVRADQIALSRCYWSAHKIAEDLRTAVPAVLH